MLVISRHAEEAFIIGDNIEVKVLDIGTKKVRLGIAAPADTLVLRSELVGQDWKRPRKCAGGIEEPAPAGE